MAVSKKVEQNAEWTRGELVGPGMLLEGGVDTEARGPCHTYSRIADFRRISDCSLASQLNI